jgi:ABC-2 type transport system permease protein
LLAWLVMSFTSLTRSQAFSLVIIFLWPLLIESLIALLFTLVPALSDYTDLLRFLPFQAGNRVLSVVSGFDATSTFGDPLSPLGGGLIFGGVTATLMVLSYVSFKSRDA